MPYLLFALDAAEAAAIRVRGIAALVFVIVVVALIAAALYLVLRFRRSRSSPPGDDWPQGRRDSESKDQPPWP